MYKVKHFNLDAVIGVGYLVSSKKSHSLPPMGNENSERAVQKGCTINRHRIKANYNDFLKAVSEIKGIVSGGAVDSASVLELVTLFVDTWFSLDEYNATCTDGINFVDCRKRAYRKRSIDWLGVCCFKKIVHVCVAKNGTLVPNSSQQCKAYRNNKTLIFKA